MENISKWWKSFNASCEEIVFSQKGTTFSIQRINVMLKEIKKKYRLHVGNFSCHSLRKTFGRQVYTMSGENAELALVKLMELFNHSSVAITKRYLGLRQEEILEAYDMLSFWYLAWWIFLEFCFYIVRLEKSTNHYFTIKNLLEIFINR